MILHDVCLYLLVASGYRLLIVVERGNDRQWLRQITVDHGWNNWWVFHCLKINHCLVNQKYLSTTLKLIRNGSTPHQSLVNQPLLEVSVPIRALSFATPCKSAVLPAGFQMNKLAHREFQLHDFQNYVVILVILKLILTYLDLRLYCWIYIQLPPVVYRCIEDLCSSRHARNAR